MPTISTFSGVVVQMFFRDHPPPHFRARCGDHWAAIEIGSLEILAGSLPRRTLTPVREWAVLHRDELQANWELCRRHERPRRIAPWE